MIDKRRTLEEALAAVRDGMTVMIGGFGFAGNPRVLIAGVVRSGRKDLTIVSNNAGTETEGIGELIGAGAVRKMIMSFIGPNNRLQRLMMDGKVEVDLIPQGTIAERARAAGAGLGGFYTPTGVGTELESRREVREIGGKRYLFELPLHADVALIKAWRADRRGNLVYRKTARNFNPIFATAAAHVIAEVEEIVPVGELDPERVSTPSVYVDAIVEVPRDRSSVPSTGDARKEASRG